MIKTVAIYAASSTKLSSEYQRDAYLLGQILAQNGIEIIYGAGSIGLMQVIADSALSAGGRVVGVIPQFMVDEDWHHKGLSELLVTQTMHERKAVIEERADAMVALAGGIGTAEELLEQMTWKQLGIHSKPIVILNTNGYYDYLLRWLDRATEENFMRDIHRREMFGVANRAEDVLPLLSNMRWDIKARKHAKI